MSDASNRGNVRYRTIVADPPWEYEPFVSINRTHGRTYNRRVTKPLPYPSMTLAEIRALPVGELADRDCFLWCWTTNRYLPEIFPLVSAWGFSYAQTIVWHKLKFGSPFGGSVAPNRAEYLILARKGSPRLAGRWDGGSVVAAPGMSGRRKGFHSRKPEVFLDLIEQVSPEPRLELFARRQRFGWDTWGNEALEHVEVVSGL